MARVGDDCDADQNRPVDFTLTFDPPIPQGAVAQVVWSYGGPNAQGETTVVEPLGTDTALDRHTHSTDMPPRPPVGTPPNACSYSASAAVTVVIDGNLCPIAPVNFCLVVESCLPCPGDPARDLPPVTLSITPPNEWCAPPQAGQAATFEAVVNFPAETLNPPVPSAFDWSVTTPTGATFLRRTTVGSATTANGWRLNNVGVERAVDLTQPGEYSVSVAVQFPLSAGLPTEADGTPRCNITAGDSFHLDPCKTPEPCPSITALNVTPDCADPAAGVTANVRFSVSTTDPSGLASGFAWDFGDPASGSANQTVTTTPNATHSYSGTGNFTVTVRVNTRGDCEGGGPTTATTLVSVPLCPCPSGQTRNASGRCVNTEDFGCLVLRELAAGFAALAIVVTLLAFCLFPPGPPSLIALGVAGALAVVAIVLLAIWLFIPCQKPCGWGLLIMGQILFGAGWGALYFAFCCGWIGVAAVFMLLFGAGLLYLWFMLCRPTICRIFRELAWVLTVVVAPVVALILIYPPALLCAATVMPAPIVNALLTLAAAVIVARALACSEE